MSHLDDDDLAAVAIGDTIAEPAAEHLATCIECQAELERLSAVAARITGTSVHSLTSPPPHVWDAIQGELETDTAIDGSATAQPAAASESNVTPLARRGAAPRRVAWLAAAVAVVIGGVGIGLALTNEPQPVTVATAPLVDLATEADAGIARVEQRQDGTRVLVVDTTATQVDDADLEVWLIDPNIEGMVSLGFLTSDTGEFEIPAGYSVADYPIVDVSVEPRDGVPTHSGDSVTRGVLTASA